MTRAIPISVRISTSRQLTARYGSTSGVRLPFTRAKIAPNVPHGNYPEEGIRSDRRIER